jgi:CheY-like chemotaxis protein
MLDVMMHVMDGPTTLRRLLEQQQTSDTPVVFMTARAQPHEINSFIALGAVGVISKPFDPMTLAESVRQYARPAPTKARAFNERMRREAETLAALGLALGREGGAEPALVEIRAVAHGLAGAGAIFGFPNVSTAAAALADAAEAMLQAAGTAGDVRHALDRLVAELRKE